MVDPLTLVLGSVATGGIVTIIVQAIIQHSSQKRQLLLDISKYKFQTIQKSSPDYVSMTSALARFGNLYTEGDEFNDEKFYSMCKYFRAYWRIQAFELDSFDGEDVICSLSGEIFRIFNDMGSEGISKMIDLVDVKDGEKPIRFEAFKNKIPKPLLNEFCEKIIKVPHNNKKLGEYCLWLREIILFEINNAYNLWYDESPKFDMTEKLKKYLNENNYQAYVKRLEVTKKSKIEREFFKLQRWISK